MCFHRKTWWSNPLKAKQNSGDQIRDGCPTSPAESFQNILGGCFVRPYLGTGVHMPPYWGASICRGGYLGGEFVEEPLFIAGESRNFDYEIAFEMRSHFEPTKILWENIPSCSWFEWWMVSSPVQTMTSGQVLWAFQSFQDGPNQSALLPQKNGTKHCAILVSGISHTLQKLGQVKLVWRLGTAKRIATLRSKPKQSRWRLGKNPTKRCIIWHSSLSLLRKNRWMVLEMANFCTVVLCVPGHFVATTWCRKFGSATVPRRYVWWVSETLPGRNCSGAVWGWRWEWAGLDSGWEHKRSNEKKLVV